MTAIKIEADRLLSIKAPTTDSDGDVSMRDKGANSRAVTFGKPRTAETEWQVFQLQSEERFLNRSIAGYEKDIEYWAQRRSEAVKKYGASHSMAQTYDSNLRKAELNKQEKIVELDAIRNQLNKLGVDITATSVQQLASSSSVGSNGSASSLLPQGVNSSPADSRTGLQQLQHEEQARAAKEAEQKRQQALEAAKRQAEAEQAERLRKQQEQDKLEEHRLLQLAEEQQREEQRLQALAYRRSTESSPALGGRVTSWPATNGAASSSFSTSSSKAVAMNDVDEKLGTFANLNVCVEVWRGNLAQQNTEAIVGTMTRAGGFDGQLATAIKHAAGSKIVQEANDLLRLSSHLEDIPGCFYLLPTFNVVTCAGRLDTGCRYIIHTAPPCFNPRTGEESMRQLRATVANALKEAEYRSCSSIAIPALGTHRTGGYSSDLSAKAIADAVHEYSEVLDRLLPTLNCRFQKSKLRAVKLIRLVGNDDTMALHFLQACERVFGPAAATAVAVAAAPASAFAADGKSPAGSRFSNPFAASPAVEQTRGFSPSRSREAQQTQLQQLQSQQQPPRSASPFGRQQMLTDQSSSAARAPSPSPAPRAVSPSPRNQSATSSAFPAAAAAASSDFAPAFSSFSHHAKIGNGAGSSSSGSFANRFDMSKITRTPSYESAEQRSSAPLKSRPGDENASRSATAANSSPQSPNNSNPSRFSLEFGFDRLADVTAAAGAANGGNLLSAFSSVNGSTQAANGATSLTSTNQPGRSVTPAYARPSHYAQQQSPPAQQQQLPAAQRYATPTHSTQSRFDTPKPPPSGAADAKAAKSEARKFDRDDERAESKAETKAQPSNDVLIRCVSLNILSSRYLSTFYNAYPRDVMDTAKRYQRLLHAIEKMDADVYCMQEVDKEFPGLVTQMLGARYTGVYMQKSHGREEGLLTLYRSSMFKHTQSRSLKLPHADHKNGGFIATFVVLQLLPQAGSKSSADKPANLLFVNTHLIGDPKLQKEALEQTQFIVERALPKITTSDGAMPVVFCGDFNSDPQSDIYKFLSGRLDESLDDDESSLLRNRGSKSKKAAAGTADSAPAFTSAMFALNNEEPASTFRTDTLSRCVDYIWFSNSFAKDSLLTLDHSVSREFPKGVQLPSYGAKAPPLPDRNWGTDHAPIRAAFRFRFR